MGTDLITLPTAKYFAVYFLVIVLILLTLGAYRYWKYRRCFASLPSFSMELPYLPRWVLGRIPKDVSFTSYFLHELISIMNRFEEDGFCLLWFFQPMLCVFNAEYTKIFSTERATADKAPFIYKILQEMIGKGLVTTNAALWHDKRKMLNPAFRMERVKVSIPVINEGAKIMVQRLAKICNEPTVEVTNILKLGSLKILCGSMLGLDVNSEKYEAKMSRYLELLNVLAAYTMYRVSRPWLYWKTPTSLFFPSGWKHRKLYKEFHEFTNNLVLEMIDSYSPPNLESTDDENSNSGKLFARILLDKHMREPSFTVEKIQDEITAIIFGGHDTSAYTLLWSIYLMGLYPEVQERAFQEAASAVKNGTDYSHSDLSKLSYIECVIKETLRIYPTVPIFGRMINKDVECGKYTVPKGTIIGFAPYVLHRNPKYFPDPEKFDPERFFGNDVKPWTYIPFSEGMRSCIGKKYGMVAMKIVLAHILRNFEIKSLDRREDIKFDWKILLTPTKPLRFHLTPRQ